MHVIKHVIGICLVNYKSTKSSTIITYIFSFNKGLSYFITINLIFIFILIIFFYIYFILYFNFKF